MRAPWVLSCALLTWAGCNAQPPIPTDAEGLPQPYPELLSAIEVKRQAFKAAYLTADSSMRGPQLDSAGRYLCDQLVQEVFPRWYGTAWDFNGTTTTPGQGSIACGYFITTALQQVGFQLPRFRWAQLAAEPMIAKVSGPLARFSDRSVAEVEAHLLVQGDGLYAVGLDNHVGFITVRGTELRFVHSNYYQREVGVMSEPLDGNNPFAHSRYRVIGRLLGHDMMRCWIVGLPLDGKEEGY